MRRYIYVYIYIHVSYTDMYVYIYIYAYVQTYCPQPLEFMRVERLQACFAQAEMHLSVQSLIALAGKILKHDQSVTEGPFAAALVIQLVMHTCSRLKPHFYLRAVVARAARLFRHTSPPPPPPRD